MKVQIYSQNIQGAYNSLAPLRVRNYYKAHFKNIDVLCFQEHKLRGTKLLDFGNKVWRRATYLGCDASLGYNDQDGQEGAGKGGICMFISSKLAPFIHSHGNIGLNLGQWVRFKNLPGGDLAIANIYAPHSNSNARVHLWQDLVRLLDPDCRWILCGDWNMVESYLDKSSTCGRVLSRVEKFEFDCLKAHCQVEYFFSYEGPINLSWHSKRKDGPRVLARLDRFYSFASSDSNPSSHISKNIILGDCGLLHHLPICLEIQVAKSKPTSSHYKMNGSYLHNPEVVAKLISTWKGAPNLEIFGKLRRVIKVYKAYCKQRAAEFRKKEDNIRTQLEVAHAVLQAQAASPAHMDPPPGHWP